MEKIVLDGDQWPPMYANQFKEVQQEIAATHDRVTALFPPNNGSEGESLASLYHGTLDVCIRTLEELNLYVIHTLELEKTVSWRIVARTMHCAQMMVDVVNDKLTILERL